MKAVHIFGKSHLIRLAAMGVLLLALVLAQGLSRGFRPPTATRSTVGTAVPAQSGDFGTLPLVFEANAGQTDPAVRYMTHAPGGHFTSCRPRSCWRSNHHLSANPPGRSILLVSLLSPTQRP